MPPELVKILLLCAATAGFCAGKLNVDDKVRELIHKQNVKMGKLNARLLVDEMIERRAIGAGQD